MACFFVQQLCSPNPGAFSERLPLYDHKKMRNSFSGY